MKNRVTFLPCLSPILLILPVLAFGNDDAMRALREWADSTMPAFVPAVGPTQLRDNNGKSVATVVKPAGVQKTLGAECWRSSAQDAAGVVYIHAYNISYRCKGSDAGSLVQKLDTFGNVIGHADSCARCSDLIDTNETGSRGVECRNPHGPERTVSHFNALGTVFKCSRADVGAIVLRYNAQGRFLGRAGDETCQQCISLK